MSDSDVREEESGVRLGEICRVIFQWKRLLAVLASVALAAVVAFLFIKFLVNPGKIEYRASFHFNVTRVSSTSALYPSGQFFAEEDTLTALKNSDEKFRDVDIEGMLSDGRSPVKVSAETQNAAEGSQDAAAYSITVKGNLFPDAKTAQDFLKALINYPKVKAIADTKALAEKDSDGFNGYGAQLKTYGSVLTYEEKLAALLAERDYLSGLYDGWIGSYGGLYVVQSRNTTLMGLREKVQSAFTDVQYSEFSAELSANAYQRNDGSLEMKKKTYEEQKKLNEARLTSLKTELEDLIDKYKAMDSGASSIMPQFGEFHSRIAALTEENVVLNKKIEAIDKSLTNNSDYLAQEEKFGQSLEKVRTALAQEAEQIAGVAEEIVERESYTTLSEIEEEGGTNALLVVLAVAVVVFLVACAVCYAVGVRRDRKIGMTGTATEKKEATREGVPDHTHDTPNGS